MLLGISTKTMPTRKKVSIFQAVVKNDKFITSLTKSVISFFQNNIPYITVNVETQLNQKMTNLLPASQQSISFFQNNITYITVNAET